MFSHVREAVWRPAMPTKDVRARGRTSANETKAGGRPFTMTPAKVRLAMAWMGKPDTKVSELCKELEVSRQTLYRQCLARRRRSAGLRAGARPKVRGPKRPTDAESRTLRPSL